MLFLTDMEKFRKPLANLSCLTNLELCAEFAAEIAETFLPNNSGGLSAMETLVETFLSNAGKLSKLGNNREAMNKMMKVMTKLNMVDSLQAMVSFVLAQPGHQVFLAEIMSSAGGRGRL